jgi:alkylation response protein AidB-like acyl-CoA dehydrogenase
MEPAAMVDVLERLAHADGAAGWCGFIGNATSFFGWLEPEVASVLLRGAPHVAAASVFAPTGQAVPNGGDGYTVTGRWPFASGCRHSEWIQLGVMVHGDEGMQVRTDGRPDWRFAYLPMSEVEVVDDWDTFGLRGTGSNDIAVHGATVPAEHLAMPMFDAPRADEPLYRMSFWSILAVFMTPFPLGVARRALEEAEQALRDQPEGGRPLGRLDPQMQHELGRARSRLWSARAMLDDALGRAWEDAVAGTPQRTEHEDRLSLAKHQGMAAALDVVDAAYGVSGSGVIRRGNVIQRCFRDLHTARKHLGYGYEGYRVAAKRALGLPV